jgi:DNA-binding NarL/FixJ family response regulator
MTRIILADDHQMIREGISALLSNTAGIEIVRTASDGKEVLSALRGREVDLVLMDINMPELDGIQTTKAIKKTHKNVKVLILSMHNKEGFIKNAIEVGADGYILKNTGKSELLLAIERIMSGNTYFSQAVTETLVNNMRVGRSDGVTLTKREKDILELLSNGHTTAEIADKLVASQHTIETYRRNLLLKFSAKNVSEMIKISMKEGFIS